MSDPRDDMVIAWMRRLDQKFDQMSDRMDNLSAEMRAIKQVVAGIAADNVVQDTEIASLRTRMDRVERRLDLNDEVS
ncbi:MAG: hypothetical protein ACU0CI_08520 [Shimia sp.]